MAQSAFSQVSNFSLEINYPIPTGNNFFETYYSGIVDIGGKYRLVELSPINLGVSVNGSYFKKEDTLIPTRPGDIPPEYEGSEITNFTILPRIFAEWNIATLPDLRPFVALGYGFLVFNAASHGSNPSDATLENGINVNAGVYFLFTKRVFAQAQYDFIGLNDPDIPTTANTKSISILKVGLGVML